MSYPYSMAAANELVAAAVARDDALTAWGATVYLNDDDASNAGEAAFTAADQRFDDAVAAYREASSREHVNGPDMDADEHAGVLVVPPVFMEAMGGDEHRVLTEMREAMTEAMQGAIVRGETDGPARIPRIVIGDADDPST